MNATLISRIDDLLRTGKELLPEGGSEFSGYNAKKQSRYLLWRKNCLDALSALEDRGTALSERITGDENGMYFYHSSAQHIITVLEEAREAARIAAEAAEARERAEASARKEQERREAEEREQARIEEQERARREEEQRKEEEQKAQAQALREAEARKVREQEQAARETARKQIEALEAVRVKEAAENARQEAAMARAREEAEAAAAANALRNAGVSTDGTPKILLFSLENHVMLKQVQKFLTELSLEYSLITHTDGRWTSLDSLDIGTSYYAVILLSDRWHGQELMALGYLAGRYPSIKLSCIHAHTLPLGDLLPGVSRQEFTVSLDEIKPSLMKELKAAGCRIPI